MIIGAHFSGGPIEAVTKALQSTEGGYPLKAVQCFIAEGNTFYPDRTLLQPNYKASLLELKELTGIKIAAHGPYIVNCCNPSGKLYEASLAGIERFLKAADELQIDYLVLHPGSHKGEGLRIGMEALSEASIIIANGIRNDGLKTKLLWENTAGGGTQVGKIETLSRVVAEVNRNEIGMCLDTTHSFADGHDLRDNVYRQNFWSKFGPITNWVHYNNPDKKVQLDSHLDRHSAPWNDCRWSIGTMLDIAREWGPSNIPLVMEADESAYELNLSFLDEVGLLT